MEGVAAIVHSAHPDPSKHNGVMQVPFWPSNIEFYCAPPLRSDKVPLKQVIGSRVKLDRVPSEFH